MTVNNSTNKSPRRIVPLATVPTVAGYEWLLESTLRQWTFYAKTRHAASGKSIPGNGFDSCIVRVGRRVLIDLDMFDTWIYSHRNESGV